MRFPAPEVMVIPLQVPAEGTCISTDDMASKVITANETGMIKLASLNFGGWSGMLLLLEEVRRCHLAALAIRTSASSLYRPQVCAAMEVQVCDMPVAAPHSQQKCCSHA
jgi:hypothetical protein